jgi:N-methylhydantoinase B
MECALNAVELSIFASRLEAVCDEMGAVLRNAAFSPNIRDRLDYSCAVFDTHGELCAQAAHIPVHLGSMAFAMGDVVSGMEWRPGDMVILNDPYLGGTHLPDVTLIAPLFLQGRLAGFVANRAHHADIGAQSPGSMPISTSLQQEGLIIEPCYLLREQRIIEARLQQLVGRARNRAESHGDLAAQISANRIGLLRLQELVAQHGLDGFQTALDCLNAYGERLATEALKAIPDGVYRFQDVMDDDGQGNRDIPICVAVEISGGYIQVDFSGTAKQVPGNINCPLSVAAAAVFYLFRCLMPATTPVCAGSFRSINIHAPEGTLLNARYPAAVAAGNVETSTRIVDVIAGALAQALRSEMPAASHGSMNNLAMGCDDAAGAWDYYETVGGGMGAGPRGGGHSGVQTHMTNTLNTPIEVLESRYPLRVVRYGLRRGSGGQGERPGGDGLVRELEFLSRARFSLLTERRSHRPWGLAGGAPGRSGINRFNGERLPAKLERRAEPGDRLVIETAGGGGWGEVHKAGS